MMQNNQKTTTRSTKVWRLWKIATPTKQNWTNNVKTRRWTRNNFKRCNNSTIVCSTIRTFNGEEIFFYINFRPSIDQQSSTIRDNSLPVYHGIDSSNTKRKQWLILLSLLEISITCTIDTASRTYNSKIFAYKIPQGIAKFCCTKNCELFLNKSSIMFTNCTTLRAY